MTGIAVNVLAMTVQMMIEKMQTVMGFIGMAVAAGENALNHGNGTAAAGDLVIFCFVTLLAAKIQAAHMKIIFPAWLIKDAAHVGVFHSVGAAATEMTVTAGLATGATHMLGHLDQIHLWIRHAGCLRGLFIGSSGVMTDQAVNLGYIREIKGIVFPAVSGVT